MTRSEDRLAAHLTAHGSGPRALKQIRSGTPACWKWRPPVTETGEPLIVDLSKMDRWWIMVEWQDGRCAVCGKAANSLVTNHDHVTGLIRGFLYRSCNYAESGAGYTANGDGQIFDRYHLSNPASICGLVMLY